MDISLIQFGNLPILPAIKYFQKYNARAFNKTYDSHNQYDRCPLKNELLFMDLLYTCDLYHCARYLSIYK